MTTRLYSSISQETSLTSALSTNATTMVVNNASGLLAGVTPTGTQTFVVVIDPDTSLEEIVYVVHPSSPAGNTLTIIRGVDGTGTEGTSGIQHSAGAKVRHMAIGRDFREANNHIEATSNVHGVTGSVVGTSDTQILTNKTIGSTGTTTVIAGPETATGTTRTGGTITGASINGSTVVSGTPTISSGTTVVATGATISNATLNGGTITDSLLGSDLNANSKKIVGLATPTANTDAATKAYADTKLSTTGGTLSGDLSLGGNKVTGLGTPTNTGDAATKGYVDTQVSSLVDAAPGTLDTLNELAAALGDDPNFATTMTNSLAAKLDKSGGTMSGPVAMGGNKVTNLGTPTVDSDASTKGYADTKLPLAGGTVTGNIILSGGAKVTGVPTPTVSSDAVPLTYVTTLFDSTANAATSAAAALASQNAAATSANQAASSASAAATSASNASASASSASGSANTATAAAATATANATASVGSASDAADSAVDASRWASYMGGTVDGVEYSAKYYATQANAENAVNKQVFDAKGDILAGTGDNVYSKLPAGSNGQHLTVDNTTATGLKWETPASDYVHLSGSTMTGPLVLNADPSADLQAATKQYVDNLIQGLTWKPSVHLFADSNKPLSGSTGGIDADGHDLDASTNGYRILLTGQSTPSENGIYVYSDSGSGYTLTRAADANTYTELISASVFVEEGSVYGKTTWVQSNHYLTSFSGQVWSQTSGAGTYSGTAPINITGTTISLNTSGVSAGTYTAATITVDDKGIITSASSGSTLPSQSGNAGKYLTTDGSTASWAAVNASGPIVLGLMGAY